MIDKIKGKYRLICDICGEAAEEVFNTFDEAVDFAATQRRKSINEKFESMPVLRGER